jgi:hypothetical protein
MTALEYYVSGRASLLCHNPQVPAIPKLWLEFKRLFPAEDLTEFDAMIDELDKFERIRYPDEILAHGVIVGLGFSRGKVFLQDKSVARPEPEYQIGVGDVDAFFSRLFPLCGLNPQAYLTFLSSFGRKVLTEANAESKDWLSPRRDRQG